MASVACVVHLAAHVHRMGRGADRDPEFRRINVEGSRFVAEQAARAGVARFLFLSSLKVNGEGGAARAYRFDDPPNPLDLYAVSKLEAENVLRDVCLRNGMKLTIIRAPLIYGPGVGGNFHRLLHLASTGLPLPLRAIDNRRSLIGIWNLTNFMELCMDPASEAEGTWLISDGDDQSTPQLIEKLARLMSRKTRLFSVPPAWLGGLAKTVGFGREMSRLCESLRADITPARDLLAWNAPMSVDEGLSRTVSAYRAGTEHAPG